MTIGTTAGKELGGRCKDHGGDGGHMSDELSQWLEGVWIEKDDMGSSDGENFFVGGQGEASRSGAIDVFLVEDPFSGRGLPTG